ncbi:response regulator [Sandarakinorhabdus sp.]|jgi:DNA-binding response OmpR family regulator/DNA-binding CsgD family transcriptional regulator|uniref:response regulator n=1 Tax=Sandarakinorhabdus sp. TaxID=1916663 RepID=UPI0028B1AAAD|nr:response regulator [Sandarakinorhabdus sp.]
MTETHHATILVVDDAPDSLRFLTDTLEGEGYGVRIARDGHAALASLAAELPDLVLMDAVMPGIDGFETTRRIKADPALASVPVIFMTGLSETENIVDGLAAGGVDYVKKPIVLAELLARLKVHMGNARIAAGAQSALDASNRPLLALDGEGRVLWTTPKSADILDRRFGVAVGGQLTLALAGQLQRLAKGEARVKQDFADGRVEFAAVATKGEERHFRLTETLEGADEKMLAQRHGLTEREAEVLLWISRGKANREISEILGISPRTVNKHLEQIFEKMGIENRASAAAAAVKTLAQ